MDDHFFTVKKVFPGRNVNPAPSFPQPIDSFPDSYPTRSPCDETEAMLKRV